MSTTVTTLTNSATGYTALTNENRTFYERALIERLLPELHAYNDAQKSVLPRNSGTTVNWRKFTSLAIPTAALEEGKTPDGKSLAVTAVTGQAKQYGDFVIISDLLAKAGIDKAMAEGAMLCGEQAALLIDTVILKALKETGGATEYKVGSGESATAYSGKMTSELVRKIVLNLKQNNARRFPDGYYHAMITPAQAYELMGETNSGWIDAAKYGSIRKLLKGELGELHGVRFMESTNTEMQSTAFIYGADSYGVVDMEGGAGKPAIITKDFGSAGVDDPLNQRASVGWKNLFLSKVLDPNAIYKVTTTGDGE